MEQRTRSTSDYLIVDRFEEFISGIALVVMVACVCWGVISRYVTEQPSAWAAELAAIAFAWLVFVGAAAALKYAGLHMSISMLVDMFPDLPRRLVALAIDVLVLAFLGFVVWLSIVFCIDSMGDPLPILRAPRSVIYASVGVGSLCMTIRYFVVSWRHWKGTHMPSPPFHL